MVGKTRVEEYLALAREAEGRAAASRSVDAIAHWTKIAAGYRQLAQASLDNAIIGETSPQASPSPVSQDDPQK